MDHHFDPILEKEIESWSKFRRTLRREDQVHLDRLFDKARIYVEAAGSASRFWPFETLVMAVLLEHEKILAELTARLGAYEVGGDSYNQRPYRST